MSTEPIETLINRILDQYNRKPEGWMVLADHKGNVLVLGPRVGYRLKLIPVNPQEYTGVGLKIGGLEEMRRIGEGVPSYGFRPLLSRETKELFSTLHKGGPIQKRLIKKLFEMKPTPTWKLQEKRPWAILSGPVIAHPNLSAISKRQRELEAKLAKEAHRLFRRRYPEKAAIYR